MANMIKHNGKEWMPIPNFGNYFASKDGQILSFAGRSKPHLMNPMTNQDGYLYVYLYDGSGNQTKCFVHRAVLMAWVGLPKDGEETRHLNDIPIDNRLENLCWGSRIENVEDKRRNGGIPIGERAASHKLTEKQVIQIRKSFAMGKSSRELSNEYGIAHTNILTIVRGKHWKHLPTFETVVKHRYGQKSPHSTKQRKIARINIQKAIAKRRKISASREYNVIPCACGCGNYIVTPDRRGRERKYIKGHNNNWKNGTN